MPSFPSFEERSGVVFFSSEELPLLCEEPKEVLFCLPLDLESTLAISDFSDLLVNMPEVVVSWETSAQCSQYRESIAWVSLLRLERVVGLSW